MLTLLVLAASFFSAAAVGFFDAVVVFDVWARGSFAGTWDFVPLTSLTSMLESDDGAFLRFGTGGLSTSDSPLSGETKCILRLVISATFFVGCASGLVGEGVGDVVLPLSSSKGVSSLEGSSSSAAAWEFRPVRMITSSERPEAKRYRRLGGLPKVVVEMTGCRE